MNQVERVNNAGFKLLADLAKEQPLLFINPDIVRLKAVMKERAGHDKLWESQKILLSESLDCINMIEIKGPATDAESARILRHAFSQTQITDIVDRNFWASLNCFALANYVPIRWSTSNLIDRNPSRFVLNHWLENDRKGNATMRLWWLGEIAVRTAPFSERYQADALLEAMSKRVNLYHQILDRTNIIPNWRLNAAIWDYALNGHEQLFKTGIANQLLQRLNLRASTVSLDLLDDKQLRELVREATPRPKSMSHHSRRGTPPALRVLSLGGGVQSTVLCLLAEQGALGTKPDCAIFADTDWEPRAVYENIEWLRKQVSFPIHITSNGRSLRKDVLSGVNTNGRPWMTIPVYLGDENGQPAGINWRQCTSNYKIAPIHKKIRDLLGLKPRQQLSSETKVEMWLGLTTDEFTRVKPSRDWWISLRYPLIDDLPLDREQCIAWFAERYPERVLPRSACIGCPFHSSSSWLDVQRQEPEQFEEAIQLDEMLRSKQHNAGRMFRKQAFLHHRRLPLREAIQMDVQQASEENPFLDECEGYCGL